MEGSRFLDVGGVKGALQNCTESKFWILPQMPNTNGILAPCLKETNFSTPFTFPFKKSKTISEPESSESCINTSGTWGTNCTFASLPFQTKVGGATPGGGSFEEVLSSTAQASAQSSGGGPRRAEEEELQC